MSSSRPEPAVDGPEPSPTARRLQSSWPYWLLGILAIVIVRSQMEQRSQRAEIGRLRSEASKAKLPPTNLHTWPIREIVDLPIESASVAIADRGHSIVEGTLLIELRAGEPLPTSGRIRLQSGKQILFETAIDALPPPETSPDDSATDLLSLVRETRPGQGVQAGLGELEALARPRVSSTRSAEHETEPHTLPRRRAQAWRPSRDRWAMLEPSKPSTRAGRFFYPLTRWTRPGDPRLNPVPRLHIRHS